VGTDDVRARGEPSEVGLLERPGKPVGVGLPGRHPPADEIDDQGWSGARDALQDAVGEPDEYIGVLSTEVPLEGAAHARLRVHEGRHGWGGRWGAGQAQERPSGRKAQPEQVCPHRRSTKGQCSLVAGQRNPSRRHLRRRIEPPPVGFGLRHHQQHGVQRLWGRVEPNHQSLDGGIDVDADHAGQPPHRRSHGRTHSGAVRLGAAVGDLHPCPAAVEPCGSPRVGQQPDR